MKWETRAYSMQFHVEIEADTVQTWSEIPEYAGALEKAMGEGAVERFEAACAARMVAFNEMAERMYINWLQATSRV